MRDYIKPFIEDEDIEIEDICTQSVVDETEEGKEVDFPWN